jgi:hypothetical protein
MATVTIVIPTSTTTIKTPIGRFWTQLIMSRPRVASRSLTPASMEQINRLVALDAFADGSPYVHLRGREILETWEL